MGLFTDPSWIRGLKYGLYGPYSGSPDHIRARIAREQWASYKQTYVPLENQLISLIGNQGELDEMLDQADLSVKNAFDVAAQQRARMRSRRGLGLNAQEGQVMGRRRNLNETAARVEAANRVRQRDYERDTAALSGGLTGIARQQ